MGFNDAAQGYGEPDPSKDTTLKIEGKDVVVPQGKRINMPQYTGSSFDKVWYSGVALCISHATERVSAVQGVSGPPPLHYEAAVAIGCAPLCQCMLVIHAHVERLLHSCPYITHSIGRPRALSQQCSQTPSLLRAALRRSSAQMYLWVVCQ